LLGVALVIATAVHITDKAATAIADELAFAASLLLLLSCAASHWAITKSNDRFEQIAAKVFAVALLVLFCSVVSFWL
jgi:cysteine synthase